MSLHACSLSPRNARCIRARPRACRLACVERSFEQFRGRMCTPVERTRSCDVGDAATCSPSGKHCRGCLRRCLTMRSTVSCTAWTCMAIGGAHSCCCRVAMHGVERLIRSTPCGCACRRCAGAFMPLCMGARGMSSAMGAGGATSATLRRLGGQSGAAALIGAVACRCRLWLQNEPWHRDFFACSCP